MSEELRDRLQTVVDENLGLTETLPAGKLITMIERQLFEDRQRIEKMSHENGRIAGELLLAQAQMAIMREALEVVMREHGRTILLGHQALRAVPAAIAGEEGKRLAAEVVAHRMKATGICSAHQRAEDPSCTTCYPDLDFKLRRARVALEASRTFAGVVRRFVAAEAETRAELDAIGAPMHNSMTEREVAPALAAFDRALAMEWARMG